MLIGTSVIIIPVNIARRNGIVWAQVHDDEPSYAGVTGIKVDVMGQANVWAVFDNIKGGHNIQVLETRQEPEEILIDLGALIDLSIVPQDFPLRQDPELRSDNCRRVQENKQKITEFVEELENRLKEEKSRKVQPSPSPFQIEEFTLDSEVEPIQERQGSIRSALKFQKMSEETIDEAQDVEKLRKKLLRKYSAVFKRDLGKEYRIIIDPVKIELIDDSRDMGNAMIPSEAPRHLQDAADEKLARLLKSGCLEPVHHPTSNCSRAFFEQKNTKDGTIKARLVTDLRNVIYNTKRVGTPLDGSSYILNRLQHDETMLCSVDMSSGYHQVNLHEDSRDIFTIVLPAGKFPYCVLPHGASVSSDYFNICTDQDTRGAPGFCKNIEGVLVSASDMGMLDGEDDASVPEEKYETLP